MPGVNDPAGAVEPNERGDFVTALQRGLDVLQTFSRANPVLTLTKVAELTGLSRGTARRLLHTLAQLGYVRQDGREFRLTARVLNIGYAYLSALDLVELSRDEMESLGRATGESCSIAVLDSTDVVYVARAPSTRIMSTALGLGSRLPAHATSLGHVLLAGLTTPDLDTYLAAADLEPFTTHTVTDGAALRAELDRVRTQGWALIDQELEVGVRSIAAPLRNRTGCTIAAMNVSAPASRVTLDVMRRELLPPLLAAADRISEMLAKQM
jgi:IclR family transcriptional regulator, pca regulon regulatory protein